MKGAIARAEEIIAQTPNSWMPQQFDNPANVEVHRRTTAQEILADFADQPLDALITGVGTGGHITGCAEVLKTGMAEPEGVRSRTDPVASLSRRPALAAPDPGHRRRLHPSHLDTSICWTASSRSHPTTPRKWPGVAAREEGMLVGISSGATLAAMRQKLPELGEGARMLAFNYDTGERYLSVADFLPEEG